MTGIGGARENTSKDLKRLRILLRRRRHLWEEVSKPLRGRGHDWLHAEALALDWALDRLATDPEIWDYIVEEINENGPISRPIKESS